MSIFECVFQNTNNSSHLFMDSKQTFIFVVNPISGGSDKDAIVNAVNDYAAEHDVSLRYFESTGKYDEQALRALYEQFPVQRILVAGGDGTIKMVAEALLGYEVTIGIFPAGSANGLSVDLELPAAIEELLPVAFFGEPSPIDMVEINGKMSLHLSDIGLNANLIKNYEQGSIRGKLGYFWQSIATLYEQSPPFEVRIETDEQTLETEAKMVVLANSQRYGTGVTINPRGELNDGKFEIVVLKSMDLFLIGKIITGNMPLDSGEVVLISTDKAVIKTKVPVHFQIDGEYCNEQQVLKARIVQNVLNVAR